jgi:DNA-binding transcriptional LysR family regulator
VLEIASFPSFAKARLLPAVIRARARFPELKLVIHELEPADAIEAVRDGRCHLAVSFAYNFAPRPEIAGLLAQPLMEEPVLLALPPRWRRAADPVKLERLAKEDWIAGSREAEDRLLAERACAPAGFTPHFCVHCYRNCRTQADGTSPIPKTTAKHHTPISGTSRWGPAGTRPGRCK